MVAARVRASMVGFADGVFIVVSPSEMLHRRTPKSKAPDFAGGRVRGNIQIWQTLHRGQKKLWTTPSGRRRRGVKISSALSMSSWRFFELGRGSPTVP